MRFGPPPPAFRGPPLDAARRSTWEPRGWFLLGGGRSQDLDGTRDAARRSTWFGPPPP